MNDFIWKISLYRFLDAIKLVGVIFTLLFAHNGLSIFQISLLISIWSLTQLVLEVPLGAIADKYPRRNLLILALLALALGLAFWLQGGFVFYAVGFVFWGFKNAMTSGTYEAFVYDELKTMGKESLYEQINGKLEGARWLGVALSAVLGGIVATISYQLVLIFSIITTLLAICALLTITSVRPQKSTDEVRYLEVLKSAVRDIRTNTSLLGIIVFLSLLFSTYGAVDEYWGLIYQSLKLPVAAVGILVAIGYGSFSLAGSTLSFFNSKIMVGREHLILCVSACVFIIAGLFHSYISLPFIFLGLYFFKVANLKLDAKFQHAIRADQRATISSLKSLIFEIFYIGFVLLFGIISSKLGIPSMLYVLGILFIFGILLFRIFFPIALQRILAIKNPDNA